MRIAAAESVPDEQPPCWCGTPFEDSDLTRLGALPAANCCQGAPVTDGIPDTSFAVDDVGAAHHNPEQHGVSFLRTRTAVGDMVTAILGDTLIQHSSPA